jgi:hypothetical protein
VEKTHFTVKLTKFDAASKSTLLPACAHARPNSAVLSMRPVPPVLSRLFHSHTSCAPPMCSHPQSS